MQKTFKRKLLPTLKVSTFFCLCLSKSIALLRVQTQVWWARLFWHFSEVEAAQSIFPTAFSTENDQKFSRLKKYSSNMSGLHGVIFPFWWNKFSYRNPRVESHSSANSWLQDHPTWVRQGFVKTMSTKILQFLQCQHRFGSGLCPTAKFHKRPRLFQTSNLLRKVRRQERLSPPSCCSQASSYLRRGGRKPEAAPAAS